MTWYPGVDVSARAGRCADANIAGVLTSSKRLSHSLTHCHLCHRARLPRIPPSSEIFPPWTMPAPAMCSAACGEPSEFDPSGRRAICSSGRTLKARAGG